MRRYFVLHNLSSAATLAVLSLLHICQPRPSLTMAPSSFLHRYNSFIHLSLCHMCLHSSIIHYHTWCCDYRSVTGHLSSIPLHNDHVLWPSIELPFTLVSLLEHLVPSPKWHVHPHSLSAPSLLPHHLVFPEPAIHFFISINFPFPLPPYNESLLDYLFYAVFPTIVTQTSSCHLIIQFSTHLSHIPHPVLVWLSSPHTPIYHCLSFP